MFGPDIYNLFEKINKSYSWLTAFDKAPADPEKRSRWAEDSYKHSMFIWGAVNELPETFKPYVYFGDYKKEDI